MLSSAVSAVTGAVAAAQDALADALIAWCQLRSLALSRSLSCVFVFFVRLSHRALVHFIFLLSSEYLAPVCTLPLHELLYFNNRAEIRRVLSTRDVSDIIC